MYVDMKQTIPELYSKNPKIFFTPETPGSEKAAKIVEIAVNDRWTRLKMKKIFRDSIKSAKLYGVCAFKTYFNFKSSSKKEEWDDRILNDDVRTDRVPLKQLLKDPDCGWLTSPYIVHEVEAKVDTIKKKFNLKKEDNVTVVRSTQGSKGVDDPLVRSDFQYGRYYEIEDREEGKVSTIVEGVDRWAKKPEAKKYPYDTMYDFIMYNDIPDRPDVLSDYHFWSAQLKEVSIYRTMQLNHARKGNAKYKWSGPNRPTENQKSQIRSSKDSTVIELEPGQDVNPMQHASLDPNIFNVEQIVRGDIQLISKNAPRQSLGKKTATEVQAVEQASQQVSSENLERLDDVIESIATKWAVLMQNNYKAEKMIKITGMTEGDFIGLQDSIGEDAIEGANNQAFLKVSSNNLEGKVRAKVSAGSTAPDNDQARQARVAQFLAAVAQAGATQALDIEEVVKELEEIFQVENDNLTIKKDNPMEESRLLNADVYVAPKISENHLAHLEIHQRESNNSNANMAHILGHKMFAKQMEANQQATQATAAPQTPQTGQSFVGQDLLSQLNQGGAPSEVPPVGGNVPQGVQ